MIRRTLGQAMALLTIGVTIAACGADGALESGADEGVSEAAEALTSSAALFRDTSTMRDNGPDWDWCRGKATCAPGEAISGMSEVPGGYGRTALCKQIDATTFSGNVTATLTLDAGSDQRRATRLGDWAPGYWKLECGEGEYVRAVSENAMQCQGNNRFHALQCASGQGLAGACMTRAFDAGENRGTQVNGDWDYGAFKGECADNELVAGVSVEPSSGRPHSLLCCATGNPQPTCQAGQTLLDGDTCVTLTPWNGADLPDGARIAMRASTRFKSDGCSGCTGVESFGPAWVNLHAYQWNSANPVYDYLDARGAALTSDALFTVRAIPRGPTEYLSGNNPWTYQKLTLRGNDGAWVGIDSSGTMASKNGPGDAPIWILDRTRGTTAGLYYIGYTFDMNSYLASNHPTTYGSHFESINGLTMVHVRSAGFSAASFFELFIVQ